MGASAELRLVAKLVDTGEMQKVLDAGITQGLFSAGEAKKAFVYVYEYWRNKRHVGDVPTRRMIKESVPTVDLPEPDRLSIDTAIEEMLAWAVNRDLRVLSDDMVDAVNSADPRGLIPAFQRRINDLSAMGHRSTDLIMSQEADDIRKNYEDNRDRVGLTGIPWPWEVLNAETLGIQPAEFVVLYGRPKNMKTWVLLKIGTHAYDYASRKVLIYTREMHPRKILDRCVCLLIGAPYEAFRKGTLHEIKIDGGTMEDLFYATVETLQEDEETCMLETGHHKALIITSDRKDKRGGGVMGLYNKYEEYTPDLLLVDGMYLMRNDRDGTRSVKWDNMTAITQDTHDLCLNIKRPIIGTNQAKRAAEGKVTNELSDLAFSDSFSQDCDLGIRCIKRRVKNRDTEGELAMIVSGAREFDMHGFGIHAIPAVNFNQMYVPARHEDGSFVIENGRKVMVPLVYVDDFDLHQRFKEEIEAKVRRNEDTRQGVRSSLGAARSRLEQHHKG